MAKKAAKKTAEKTKRPASRRTVLAIDIGGTHVKVMTDKDRIRREFESGPTLSATEMVRQVKALGFSPDEVRHVLLTHLDRDHAGGVPDFPKAKVHVHRKEYDMAVTHQVTPPAGRYITTQWKHGPDWAIYGEGGEDWFGFEGVRALGDHEPDILMIPLPGHTLGHCGIAVRDKDRWLLHAGDAYFHHAQLDRKSTRLNSSHT